MKFKAGDRIKIKDTGDWGSDIITIGETGTIIEYSINDKVYRVEFDNYNTWKHDCGGCCRKGHGWNCEEKMLEPAYAIGGYASLHRIPTPEKPVPIEEQLVKDTFKDRLDSAFEAWRKLGGATSIIFENGSSIEALPQKDDTVRGENHFCNGFIGGKISTSGELIVPHREMERAMDRLLKALEKPSVKFGIKKLEQKLKEENNLKFTFYVTEGYRMDKSNNTRIPTMTTEVLINGKDYQYSGSATCDKTDYEEREGVLNAIANAMCGGNFDREFNKVMKNKASANKTFRTCTYCGKVFDTIEEKEAHEAWHVERRKARHERYKLRKRAKEIAFEEAAKKMAEEMIEDKK